VNPATPLRPAWWPLDTGVVVHRRSVARFCEWGTLAGSELHAGKPALFKRLIGDPDPAVRLAGIAALRRLPRPREAIDAAFAAEVGSDSKSVVELSRLADGQWDAVARLRDRV